MTSRWRWLRMHPASTRTRSGRCSIAGPARRTSRSMACALSPKTRASSPCSAYVVGAHALPPAHHHAVALQPDHVIVSPGGVAPQHNGAGKTTTINMLTGMLSPASGDAYVDGYSISDNVDAVRGLMGVCPQVRQTWAKNRGARDRGTWNRGAGETGTGVGLRGFPRPPNTRSPGAPASGQHDILWDDLTAREHVRMFCEIRCLPREDIPRIIQERLEDVQLWEVRVCMRARRRAVLREELTVQSMAFAKPGGRQPRGHVQRRHEAPPLGGPQLHRRPQDCLFGYAVLSVCLAKYTFPA